VSAWCGLERLRETSWSAQVIQTDNGPEFSVGKLDARLSQSGSIVPHRAKVQNAHIESLTFPGTNA